MMPIWLGENDCAHWVADYHNDENTFDTVSDFKSIIVVSRTSWGYSLVRNFVFPWTNHFSSYVMSGGCAEVFPLCGFTLLGFQLFCTFCLVWSLDLNCLVGLLQSFEWMESAVTCEILALIIQIHLRSFVNSKVFLQLNPLSPKWAKNATPSCWKRSCLSM